MDVLSRPAAAEFLLLSLLLQEDIFMWQQLPELLTNADMRFHLFRYFTTAHGAAVQSLCVYTVCEVDVVFVRHVAMQLSDGRCDTELRLNQPGKHPHSSSGLQLIHTDNVSDVTLQCWTGSFLQGSCGSVHRLKETKHIRNIFHLPSTCCEVTDHHC